jgi:pyochelin biosynthetic protein PchC
MLLADGRWRGSVAYPPKGVDMTDWFRRYRRVSEPRVRLVCFPYAGGSASVYRSWPHRLPDDVEVLAVQYPGRQDRLREPCVDRMDRLATLVASALLPFLDRPLALFGHSMGASLAHEVAVRLERSHGADIVLLLVSARLPPRHHGPRDVHHDDETLLADVRMLDPINSAVLDDPDMRELMLPVIRADYQVADSYRPSQPLVQVPVVAYAGDADPTVGVGQLRAWSEITTAGFALAVFPGDHFYLVSGEAGLVADIGTRLDAATGAPNGGRSRFTAELVAGE